MGPTRHLRPPDSHPNRLEDSSVRSPGGCLRSCPGRNLVQSRAGCRGSNPPVNPDCHSAGNPAICSGECRGRCSLDSSADCRENSSGGNPRSNLPRSGASSLDGCSQSSPDDTRTIRNSEARVRNSELAAATRPSKARLTTPLRGGGRSEG